MTQYMLVRRGARAKVFKIVFWITPAWHDCVWGGFLQGRLQPRPDAKVVSGGPSVSCTRPH